MMPRTSEASVPRENDRYSLRATMKQVKYFSDASDESGEDNGNSSSEVVQPAVIPSSESEEEPPNEFLRRRAKNIEDNKAMLAKLMAELKIPGDLKPESRPSGSARKFKSRPSESFMAMEPRRNPERASRRKTRSMGVSLPSSPDQEKTPRSQKKEPAKKQRSSRTSIHTIPHVVRPVDEITEEELKNIAENVKEKVYNAVHGSTCHQCRQKTIDTKTNCRNVECHGILGQFCGPCLRNRYGEDVRKALLDPDWTCPPCRGICNCSFCRQRDGYSATGILFPLARYRGYSDVHSYLNSLQKSNDEESDEDPTS